VKTQDGHRGVPKTLGLHVGTHNARRFFPRNATAVELHLDHLVIVCSLESSFWQGQPEIYDERLSSWLHSKRDSGKLGANPSPITLIPIREGCFRILLMHEERKDPLRLGPDSQITKVEVIGPIESSRHISMEGAAPAPGPLKRVAKLKGHDHPALAANY
jgi:hypothetical protein